MRREQLEAAAVVVGLWLVLVVCVLGIVKAMF